MRASVGSKSSLGIVGFLVFLELGSGLLQGWFAPLLVAIGDKFDVSAGSLNWVSAIYLLATVACVPILAKLGDMFGHKRLLTIAVIFVAAGSFVVAFAPSFEVFLLGRALQAPLAAFLPLEFAIVRDRDERSASKNVGLLVGSLTIGGTVAALASGLLYQATHDLTVVLLFPAVFLVLCVPIVILLVPETSVRKRGRVDWLGAALLALGLLSTLAGVSNSTTWGWVDPRTLGLIVAGLALLVVWVIVERRVKDPMVNLPMMTRGGIGLPIVASLLFGALTFGGQTASFLWLLSDPNRVGYGLGLSSATGGGLIVLYGLAALAGTLLGHRVARRLGSPRTIALAGVVSAISFGLMIVFSGTMGLYVTWLTVGGFPVGILLAVLPSVVVHNAPADSVGIASGLYNTARTASGAVAAALFTFVMSSFLATVVVDGATTKQSTPMSFYAVWGICAILSLALAAVALRIRDVRVPNPPEALSEVSTLDPEA